MFRQEAGPKPQELGPQVSTVVNPTSHPPFSYASPPPHEPWAPSFSPYVTTYPLPQQYMQQPASFSSSSPAHSVQPSLVNSMLAPDQATLPWAVPAFDSHPSAPPMVSAPTTMAFANLYPTLQSLATPELPEIESDASDRKENTRPERLMRDIKNALSTKKVLNPQQLLQMLIDQAQTEKRLVDTLGVELRSYAVKNLSQIGTKNNYTAEESRTTKQERAEAVSLISDMIEKTSARDVYDYVTTDALQKISGIKEIKFNIFRKHLAEPIAKFIQEYKKFLELSREENISFVLNELCVRLTPYEVATLFWFYHPLVVADFVVNTMKDHDFSYSGLYPNVSHDLFVKLLAKDPTAIRYVNENRCKNRSALLLPADSREPGASDPNEENTRGLSKFELYQYEGPTIFAIEEWFLKTYPNLFINNILGMPTEKTKESPYHFYLVPTSQYMLLDPEDNRNANYFRYLTFKKEINQLVNSYDCREGHNGVPVVFCGIINILSNHYIPYFIYKNRKGSVQVITIDPSPRVYPEDRREVLLVEGQIQGSTIKDGKLKSRHKLHRAFIDIFPGCDYSDPDVSQMLRERDCGPNSATTLDDCFRSCTTTKQVLQLLESDELNIDKKHLSVCEEPLGINPYTGMYVYPAELERRSLKSREEWQRRIGHVQSVKSMVARSATIPLEVDRRGLPTDVQTLRECAINVVKEFLTSSNLRGDLRGIVASVTSEYSDRITSAILNQLRILSQPQASWEGFEILTALMAKNYSLDNLAVDIHCALIQERPLSIRDQFNPADQFDFPYSYIAQVESQELQDLRETNISAVQSMLLSGNERVGEGAQLVQGLVENYNEHLILPSPKPLVQFLRTKVNSPPQLQALTGAHGGSVENLAKDVICVLLRDHIPNALKKVFQNKVIVKLPYSADIDPDELVRHFLDQSHVEIYSRLKAEQQRSIKIQLLEIAHTAVSARKSEVYFDLISPLLSEVSNCRRYLVAIVPDTRFQGDLVESVINLLQTTNKHDVYQDSEIRAAVTHLKHYAGHDLRHYIDAQIRRTLTIIEKETCAYVLEKMQLQSQPLSVILRHIDAISGEYVRMDQAQLNEILKGGSPKTSVLKVEETHTFLGSMIMHAVNHAIEATIQDCLRSVAQESINKLLDLPLVQACLVGSCSPLQLSDMLDANGHLLPTAFASANYDVLIQHGSASTLTLEDYKHVKVHDLVNNFLRTGINQLVLSVLTRHYDYIASVILESAVNAPRLTFAAFANCFDLNDADRIAANLCQGALQSQQAFFTYFAANFFTLAVLETSEHELSSSGRRFHHWFVVNKCNLLKDRYQQALELQFNLQGSSDSLKTIVDLLKDKTIINKAVIAELTAKIQASVETLDQMNGWMQSHLNLVQNFEAVLKKMHADYRAALSSVLGEIIRLYRMGDITPGSLAASLRPFLCRLLDVQASAILSSREAAIVDSTLISQCGDLPAREAHKFNPDIPLIGLKQTKALPVSYGLPITRQLVIDCIAYWYSNWSTMQSVLTPALWFAHDNMPRLIRELIDIVNSVPAFDADPDVARKVKAISHMLSSRDTTLDVFSSTDILGHIKVTLLRTSTLTATKSTEIPYSDLAQILVLESKSKQPVIPPDFSGKIRTRLQEKVQFLQNQSLNQAFPRNVDLNKLRESVVEEIVPAELIQKKMEDLTAVKRAVAMQVNQDEVRSMALRSFAQPLPVASQFNRSQFASDVTNVTTEDVKVTGLRTIGLFMGLEKTHMEKEIEKIKQKHQNQDDFFLDEDDVFQLTQLVKNRWIKLAAEMGEDKAEQHYLAGLRDRKDNVYIAVADLLASYYRAKKIIKYSCTYSLLMPDHNRYPSPDYLMSRNIPHPICQWLGIEEAHIGTIPIANLVITRTGFAFDIDWIVNSYIQHETLNNPYNGHPFTELELDTICDHPKAARLLNHVLQKSHFFIENTILDLIIEYLNTAIMSSGFSGYYNQVEDDRAFAAWERLNVKLSIQPTQVKEAFFKQTIPGTDTTFAALFKASEPKPKMVWDEAQQKQVVKMKYDPVKKMNVVDGYDYGSCLTSKGTYFAKYVIACKGDHHGLRNLDLVNRAKEGGIPERKAVNSRYHSNEQEQYLLVVIERKKAEKGHHPNLPSRNLRRM